MKLLHVIASIDPKLGGVSQAVCTMVLGLSALGVENEVVSLDAPNAAFLDRSECKLYTLGPARGPWQYSPLLRPWLQENLLLFDAVIIHGLWLYHGFAVRRAIKSLQKDTYAKVPKVFVMPHGMLDPYFQLAAGRKMKAVRNWAYWKLIEEEIVNEAEGIFFTSEEEKRLAAKPFNPYHPKNELVAGLGVEAPPTSTSAMREAFIRLCPYASERPYLLFLSRVHEKKGLTHLLDAYAEIVAETLAANEERANRNLAPIEVLSTTYDLPHLVIAGPGLETPFGLGLQQRVSNSPLLHTNISFAGMLTGDAKWGAFYDCQAFVLPSHQENFGIAVVEALACGKPVLISNQVNIWQQIEEEQAGLVANDSHAGTKHLLSTWCDLSTDEKGEMSQHARKAYLSHFAVVPAAKHLLQEIESILNSRRSAEVR